MPGLMQHVSERRASYRVPLCRQTVVWTVEGARHAQCLDISAGGLGLWLESPLRVGLSIDISVPTDEGGSVRVRGEVEHADRHGGGGVGVRFTNIDQYALVAIHALTDHR